MSLLDLSLKKAYSSDFDDILYDFYIPALAEAIEYDRIAGFFSSASLAISARGILGLVKNNGVMKIIVSPKLSKKDLEVLIESHNEPEKFVEERMLQELDKLEVEFVRDHVYALGWMVANGKLEIKVALLYDEFGKSISHEEVQQRGIFHQKVGILKDSQGNTLSFSGSVNETATGWLENIEEFKVFRSWEPFEQEYIEADRSKFNIFWNNQSRRVRVMRIPRAVEEKLIEVAPDDIEKINLQKWYRESPLKKPKGIELFQYQKEAVESWVSNKMSGIFEMATGTGKTFTALGCLKRASGTYERLVTIVACPFNHLITQWKEEIKNFGINFECLIADSTNPSWKNSLADTLVDISLGYKANLIVLTTYDTFSLDSFKEIIRKNKSHLTIFLIADEVHVAGAKEKRKALIDEYDLRLGLSATPKRWFDSAGTQAIYDYFNDTVFEFDLEKAVNTINPHTGKTYLAPYRYIARFVTLKPDELDDYIDKSKKIAKRFHQAKSEEERDEMLEALILYQRAAIIKNAWSKYEVLENILSELGSDVKWAIIYCTPQQIDKVAEIVNERDLLMTRFTEEQGAKPEKRYGGLSERDDILKKFAEEKYQVLVAMNILDVGVDVPPARNAILMASSGNPREHIQRIGRVIRRYPGKEEATIYDVVVIPSLVNLPKEMKDVERKIFEKEIIRYEEIASIAINNAEALRSLHDIKNRLLEAGQ